MVLTESTTFNRNNALELKAKLDQGQSFLLFGPRQTGKTTILETLFDQIPPAQQLRYYLQLPATRSALEADPDSLARAVAAAPQKPVYLFIDEIQKVPAVMDVLQFLLDRKQIILAASGSSARKLRSLGTNWLPGRVHLEHLYPLTWSEAGWLTQPSVLPTALLYGALPAIVGQTGETRKAEDLAAYSHLYLEEEIRMEAVVRQLPRFTKFLRLAALESGTAPNYSKIANEVGVSPPTIREYFQILQDTLITHTLEAFASSRSRVARTPKYYFFDLGVRNAASGIGHSTGLLPLQIGTFFEHFIVLECLAHWHNHRQLAYWGAKQAEVDLIISDGSRHITLEIKATTRPSVADCRGLHQFRQTHPCERSLLVCQIDRPQQFEDVTAIPWWQLHEYIT